MRAFLFYILLVLTSVCYGQNNLINYGTKDGLPSNQVYDIYQDKHGIIWFATDRGLSSFNGSYFTNFTTLDGLLSDVIFDFYPQEDGTVWCSTIKNELFYFDPLKKFFIPFRFNKLIPYIYGHEIKSLLIDNGDYFIRLKGRSGYIKISSNGNQKIIDLSVTYDSGEYFIHRLKKDFYYYSRDKHNAINHYPLSGGNRDMIIPYDQNVARIYTEYVEIIDKEGQTKSLKLIERGDLLQIGTFENSLWVTGFNIGVKLINSEGEIYKTYLPNSSCTKIFKDNDKNTWVSTLNEGIYLIPSTYIHSISATKNDAVNSMSTAGNELVYGTITGGIVKYSFENGYTLLGYAPSSGTVTQRNNKFYSNLFGGIRGLELIFVRKWSDNQNKPLVATMGREIIDVGLKKAVYTGSDYLFDAEYFDDYLIVSEGTRLTIVRKDGSVLKIVDFKTRINDVDVIGDKIYCATSNLGLLVLDKQLKLRYTIDTKSGLKSNFISEVKVQSGNIWLATRNGFSQIEYIGTANQKVSTVGVSNGLSDQEVKDFAFMGDTVFVGTRRGIDFLNLNNWDKIVENKSSIFFSFKKISQQGSELSNTQNLAYYQNDLTVEIELASYQINKEILFRYKLEGIDEKWTITRSRIINFKSLPPGKYELLVQAKVNDNWNEKIIRQKIRILPAWYSTWWFISSIISLIIVIIWLFFKYRILNYNREIIREILRQLLKRLKAKGKTFVVRSNGKDIKVNSDEVLYIKSYGNYIYIYTTKEKIIVRQKISSVFKIVPDPIEYLQIKRSIIIRIDQVKSKSINSVTIGDKEIAVGPTFVDELKKIHL